MMPFLRCSMKVVNGTVGTAAADLLAEDQGRRFLQVHNPSSTAKLAVAPLGTDPVVGSVGVTLFPGGTMTFETNMIPTQAWRIVADTAGSRYVLWYV